MDSKNRALLNTMNSTRAEAKVVLKDLVGSGGGGGGAVDSVNGQTGEVVLGATDVGAYTTSEVDTALDGKADTSHTHTIGEVTGLQAGLDAKADSTHTHTISEVTDLQAGLDAKADSSSVYTKAETDQKVISSNLWIPWNKKAEGLSNSISSNQTISLLDVFESGSGTITDGAISNGDYVVETSGSTHVLKFPEIPTGYDAARLEINLRATIDIVGSPPEVTVYFLLTRPEFPIGQAPVSNSEYIVATDKDFSKHTSTAVFSGVFSIFSYLNSNTDAFILNGVNLVLGIQSPSATVELQKFEILISNVPCVLLN